MVITLKNHQLRKKSWTSAITPSLGHVFIVLPFAGLSSTLSRMADGRKAGSLFLPPESGAADFRA
jgi:hypothetical protein